MKIVLLVELALTNALLKLFLKVISIRLILKCVPIAVHAPMYALLKQSTLNNQAKSLQLRGDRLGCPFCFPEVWCLASFVLLPLLSPEFFKFQLLPVKHSVGEMSYPVTQNKLCGTAGQGCL